MCDENKEVRNAAREYYSLHVTHRSHLFNLMLVYSAASIVAYSTAISKDEYLVAGSIAAISVLVLCSFLAVNTITLNKILKSKEYLKQGLKAVEDLYEMTEMAMGMTDSQWKNGIHLVLIFGFLVGAIWAFVQRC